MARHTFSGSDERELELPDELAAALADDPAARAAFDALAVSHGREYANWVAEAKRPETRTRRAGRALEMLSRDEP